MNTSPSFIHLTDLHIGAPGVEDEHLFSDTSTTLTTILAEIKTIAPRPEFIVVSGDLTNRGDVDSYATLLELVDAAGLDMPILYALGNHDTREGFYKSVLKRTDNLQAPYDHDAVIAGLQVILLDTSIPGRIGGAFEPGQIEWLEERLNAHPDLPKLLIMHHPPALDEEDPSRQWEMLSFADTARLRALVSGRNIAGIFSGHVHYDRVSLWHGIPVVVTTGQHTSIDLLRFPENLRMVAGAGFSICKLRPSGLTVSFVPQPSDRRELLLMPLADVAAADEIAAPSLR